MSITIWLTFIAVPNPVIGKTAALGLQAEQCQSIGTSLPSLVEQRTFVTAKNAEVTPGETLSLTGDVRITRGETEITADQAELNVVDNTVDLIDRVHILNNGLCVQGASASGDFFEGLGSVQSARFRLSDAGLRGQAEEIKLAPSRRLDLSEGLVTRCPEGSNTWQISSASLTADPDQGRITAKNMALRLGKLPILYLPYIKLSTDSERQSGFLPIGLSQNSRNGVESSLDYYLNIQPNFDATMTARHLTQRGTILGGEIRGLGPFYAGQINTEYLPGDDFDIWNERSDAPEQDRKDRHIISVFHAYTRGLSSSKIKFIEASDVHFLRDFDSDVAPYAASLGSIEAANPQYEKILSALNQSVEVKLKGRHLGAQLYYQGFQSLTPLFNDQAEKRPSLLIDYHRRWGSLQVSALARATEFRESRLADDPFKVQRQTYQTTVSWQKRGVWGKIESIIGFQRKHYASGFARFDAGSENYPYLQLLGTSTLFKRSKGAQTTKTLEPRISLVLGKNEEWRNQPLLDSAPLSINYEAIFDPTGASGNDLAPVNRNLSAGLAHRWIDSSSGRETLSARFGIRHQSNDQNGLIARGNSRSQLLIDLSIKPSHLFSSQLQLAFDRDRQKIRSGFLNLKYQPSPGIFASVQHRYQTFTAQSQIAIQMEELSVSQVAFSAPLGARWRVMGLWGKNNTSGKNIESVAGLSYNACCWSIEAAYRRYFDPQLVWNEQRYQIERESRSGLFLTLELKGLMRIGSDISRVFQRSVPIFQPIPR